MFKIVLDVFGVVGLGVSVKGKLCGIIVEGWDSF